MRTGYRQYAILTEDPAFKDFYEFIERYNLQFEPHLNRTRALIPTGKILTEFLLRFPSAIYVADYGSYS